MRKTLVSNLRNFRSVHETALGFAVLLLLSSLNSTAFSQAESEALDIGNLRAQLETSRADSKTTDSDAPLQQDKNSLDQQEEALMKKLQNVVAEKSTDQQSDKPSIAAVNAKTLAKEPEIIERTPAAEKQPEEVAVSKKKEVAVVPAVAKVEVASADTVKIPSSEKASTELRKKVSELQAKLNDKSKELEETRNRLVIAETQVERLSGILEKLNSSKLAGYMGSGSKPANANPELQKAAVNPNVSNSAPAANTVKSREESLVGIVTVAKAFLRSGPSKDDSPIMSVSKGTRLVVETRNNEWFRVITPTGGRAWISTEMLGFGAGAQPGSDSALRIGGYEKILR